LVSERDHGIYDALNKGLRLATGDVVGFMHADDVYADASVLADVTERFKDPRVDAVYGDLVYVDAADTDKIVRLWKAGEFDPTMLRKGWMPPHPTLYARRALYQRLGGFDTRYRIAADYDCMVRFLCTQGLNVAYVPRVLVRMRVGGISNRSVATVWRKSMEDLDIIRQHRLGGLGTLLAKNAGKLHQFWRR
jgi:glycosyltransferase